MKKETNDPFGIVLRDARQKLKWTQRELGRRAGFEHSTISHFERGSRRPSATAILRLAEVLNHPIEAMFLALAQSIQETSLLENK